MTRRSPLPWLGAVLVLYLVVPVAAFFVRLGTTRVNGFSSPGLWPALRTSVESATIATAVIGLSGVPLAYLLARHRGRVARAVGVLVILPLGLPPVMGGILLLYLIGPYTSLGRLFDQRLTGSVAGIVLAQIFVAAPFLVISARSAFAAVDPALDDLAAALGHGPLRRFLRVDLPGAAMGIRAGLLLTWLRAVGEYGANVIVAYHPYSIPVYTYVQFSGPGIPTTQAPTLLVLAAAVVAVGVSQIGVPRRRPSLPGPICDPPPEVEGPARWVPAGPAPMVRPPGRADPPGAPRGGRRDGWPVTPVGFDLDLHVGEFHLRAGHAAETNRLAFLGPSGSGKSMTLRSLAGLYGSAAGPVTYAGRVVTEPTEVRGIGYVPQGQTLLPHLDVAGQVLFGRRADPDLARHWLDAFGLAGLERRYPGELSGGQRQRVSLVAALACQPVLLLLDEPFSALDSPVRADLRAAVRGLQLSGLSTVLVTHDPTEAAELSDEVVVLSRGRVLQAGPTDEVFARPVSRQVARLVGFENVVAGRTVPGGVDIGGVVVAADEAGPPGRDLWVAIRADAVIPDPAGDHRGEVIDRSPFGGTVRLGGGPLIRVRSSRPLGDRYSFTQVSLVPPAGEPISRPGVSPG